MAPLSVSAEPGHYHEVVLSVAGAHLETFVENPETLVTALLGDTEFAGGSVGTIGLPLGWQAEDSKAGLTTRGLLIHENPQSTEPPVVSLLLVPTGEPADPRESQLRLESRVLGSLERTTLSHRLRPSEAEGVADDPAGVLGAIAAKAGWNDLEPEAHLDGVSPAFLQAWPGQVQLFADPRFDVGKAAENEIAEGPVFHAPDGEEPRPALWVLETTPVDRILTDTNEIHPGVFTEFEGGLLIGAHPQALEEPLEVEVRWFDPEAESDFPVDDRRIEGVDLFLEVVATGLNDEAAWTDFPRGAALYVAIPVQEFFDPRRLQLADLSYGDLSADSDGDLWHLSDAGVYDESSGLYVFNIVELNGGDYPARFGLIEHAERAMDEYMDGAFDFILEEYFPDAERGGEGGGIEPASGPSFDIRWRPSADEDQSFINTVENALHEAYPVYRGLVGSPEPKMRTRMFSSTYKYYVEDEDNFNTACDYAAGYYRRTILGGKAVTCYGISAVARTTRHELFHAFQYDYDTTRDVWVLEGTTRVAENLDVYDIRETVREVDIDLTLAVPLNEGYPSHQRAAPYRTELFWVYLLDRGNLGLEDLGRLFQIGLTTSAAETFVPQFTPYNSLAEAHWHWVRNATFEADFNPSGAYGAPNQVNYSTFHEDLPVISISPDATLNSYTFQLQPLSARMIEVVLPSKDEHSRYDFSYETVSGAAPRVRLYTEDGDTGSDFLLFRDPEAESAQHDEGAVGTIINGKDTNIWEPTSRRAWVLFANPNRHSSASYRLTIEGPTPDEDHFPIAHNFEHTLRLPNTVTFISPLLTPRSEDPNDSFLDLELLSPDESGTTTVGGGEARALPPGTDPEVDWNPPPSDLYRIRYQVGQNFVDLYQQFEDADRAEDFSRTDAFNFRIRNTLGLTDRGRILVNLKGPREYTASLLPPLVDVEAFYLMQDLDQNLIFMAELEELLAGFIVDPDGRPQPMGDPGVHGPNVAKAVNDHGLAVGWLQPPGDAMRPYVWRRDRGFEVLASDPRGHGRALDLDNQGLVVGQLAQGPGSVVSSATVWEEGEPIDLGASLSGGSVATAVNEEGQVVGLFDLPDNPVDAFGTWTHRLPDRTRTPLVEDALNSGARAFLHDLSSGETQEIEVGDGQGVVPRAINAAGEVAGVAAAGEGGRERRAFLWRDGGAIDLGSLGGLDSKALALNNQRQVVGVSENPDGEPRGFFWQENEGMVDLNRMIPDRAGREVIVAGISIADDGSIIAIAEDVAGRTRIVGVAGPAEPAPQGPPVSYEDWISRIFADYWSVHPNVPFELLAPMADLSGDGFKNLKVYAFGGDPFVPGSALPGQPRLRMVDSAHVAGAGQAGLDQEMELTFVRRTGADDLDYRIKLSSDLQDWRESPFSVTKVGDPVPIPGEPLEIVTYRILTSGAEEPIFVRVHIDWLQD